VILEPAEDPVLDPELETLNPLQKEIAKDVNVSEDLTETQQADVRALLEEYKDTFMDFPCITNVSEHEIQLTTSDPSFKGRAFPLPLAFQETLEREIDSMAVESSKSLPLRMLHLSTWLRSRMGVRESVQTTETE